MSQSADDSPKFRYAVNTNVLKKLPHSEIAVTCAEAGADGIEWGLPAIDKAEEYARDAVKASQDNGLEAMSFINSTRPSCFCRLLTAGPYRKKKSISLIISVSCLTLLFSGRGFLRSAERVCSTSYIVIVPSK